MRALGWCGISVSHRAHVLGFPTGRIPYRTLHASRRVEGPRILYKHQNGSTAATVSSACRRCFSAGGRQNSISKWSLKPSKPAHRYRWASPAVPKEHVNIVHDGLEAHFLNKKRRRSEGFPYVLDPRDPEIRSPPTALESDGLDHGPDPRKTYDALAIDCEMVIIKGRKQGLLSIAVVDFFTGRIVLRSLVRPADTVTDWRRDVTGFNKAMLNEAIKKGKVLSGWEKVRDIIFSVTNPETIFIGHGLAHDLLVLRIAADRVIDSMTMMSRAVFGDVKKFPRKWGLKDACKSMLNVDVQKTRGPHNPLEDALAARELVLQSVLDPEKLEAWAARTRANLALIAQKEQAKLEAKIEKKKRRAAEREKRKKKDQESEETCA